MSKSALDEIRELVHGHMELNAPVGKMTTIRAGGAADLLIKPLSREDLSSVVRYLSGRDISYRVIGAGSSVIVRDGGIRGAVILLTDGFVEIVPTPDWSGSPRIRAGAGAEISQLVAWASTNGFSGLEFLGGIPGTLGGAIKNNAFGWGKAIGDVVDEIEVMDSLGNVSVAKNDDIGFGDRRTNLPEDFIIISATLKGSPGVPEEIELLTMNFKNRRLANFPVGQNAAGMVFRNVPNQAVERLIEACGLKGVQVGDAQVSRLHANFIVNVGEAEASNVISLMGMIQERVFFKYKMKLESALTVIGGWQKAKVRIKE